MKTKSKRFQNLAALCLALLGTTLLMVHPVNAKEVFPSVEVEGTSNREYYSETQGEYEEEAESFLGDRVRDREFGRQNGEKDGKEGKNGFGPTISRDNIPVRENIKHEDEYKNGYQEGYSQGWHQVHPFQGAVFDVFSLIWGVISGLFNGVN
ncbi:hypothetical protein [Streptococcus pyogenes]|uniref:hypothetical protein n=1 Tax=Streptococcus pyogenes TaxID=1314 RepID=UPI003204B0A2